MKPRTILILAAAVVGGVVLAVLLWPRAAGEPQQPQPQPTSPPAEPASPSPSSSTTPTAGQVAVFIGDSYTVGSGTSLSGTGFPAMLGELRGWEVVNLGIAGTGYATARDESWCPPAGCLDYAGVIPDAVAHDPDVVIVSGGRNDLGRNSAAELEAPVADFYTALRDALPNARIVVTSPIWDDPPPPRALLELSDIVQREAARVDAEYLDLGDPLEGRPELIAPDGLHPNEEGLRVLADRIHELLPPTAG